MKTTKTPMLKTTTTLIFIFTTIFAQAQLICEIQFTYDAAGNRLSREEVCYTPKTSFIPEETIEPPAETENLAEEEEGLSMSVFPNPASSACRVALSRSVAGGALRLFDYSGKILQHQTISGSSFDISLQGLSSGLYRIEIRAEGERVQKAVMKE